MLRYVGKTMQNEFGEMNSFRIGEAQSGVETLQKAGLGLTFA